MKYLIWMAGLAIVGLALSVPISAHAAELGDPSVGSWQRGVAALEAGDLDVAGAHLRSVSKRQREHAEAMRTLGWEVLAEGQGELREGLGYLNRALLADPFSPGIWRDWGRAHLRLAGWSDGD